MKIIILFIFFLRSQIFNIIGELVPVGGGGGGEMVEGEYSANTVYTCV
jgi:hypothetical protein